MQAIILAAGQGKGLSEDRRDRPKALIEFAGRSLLQRHLDTFSRLEISPVVITTGFLGEQIAASLNGSSDVIIVPNDRYDLGSTLSLHRALEQGPSGDALLVINADVLCDPRIVERMINDPGGNLIPLDRGSKSSSESVRVFVQQGKIVEIRKGISSNINWTICGESMGLFLFSAKSVKSLRDVVSDYVRRGEADVAHIEIIRDLALADFNFFGIVDITGLPWIEIERSEDIERAEGLLPSIDR